MRRACFMLQINDGAEERYERLHAEMSSDVVNAIRDAGRHNYSLFRVGTTVIGYVEAERDFSASTDALAASATFQDWAREFDGVFAETRNGLALLTEVEEIWHVD